MITKEYKTVRYEMSVYYEHQRFDITSNSVSIPCVIKRIQGKNSIRKKVTIRMDKIDYEKAKYHDGINGLNTEMEHYLDEIVRRKLFSKLELLEETSKNINDYSGYEVGAIIVNEIEKVACEVTYNNNYIKLPFPILKEPLYESYLKLLKNEVLYKRLYKVCDEYKETSIALSDDSEFINVLKELSEIT